MTWYLFGRHISGNLDDALYTSVEGVYDGILVSDVNECQLGTSTCDEHATCTNTPGAYRCRCEDGFNGDGFSCRGVGR